MTLAELPEDLTRLCGLALGLVWGSFLNVVIHRLPRAQSLVRPASHCPRCKAPIAPWWNVPVLSWLLLGGRARCCQAPISVRYPLVELAGGVLSLAIVDAVVRPLPGTTPVGQALAIYVVDLALALALVAAAFIDLEHMLVPDSISIGGTLLGLGTFSLRDLGLFDAVLGAAIGFLVVWLPFDVLYRRVRGRVGMGMGDAKLLMLAGAWFGYPGALLVLGGAAVQGAAVTLLLLALGRPLAEPEAVRRERAELRAELASLPPEERSELERELALDPLAEEPEPGVGKARVAFGPFLILATLECLLVGPDRITAWLVGP